MPIDTQTEALVSLANATKLIPSHPSMPTIWRWVLTGSRGAILETIVIGGRRFTSSAAIDRFISATDRAGRPEARREASREARSRHAAAEREAASIGI